MRLKRSSAFFVSGLFCALVGSPSPSAAAVIWSSGFETNDFSDWNYELNPEGLSVVTDPVAAGQYALRAELTAQTVWDNGIFRTELQYKPTKSTTSEGRETYFGWSIYLPAALPAGDYQLGYWETRSTYNQVFSLHAEGSDLALVLNHKPETSKHTLPGLLTTGVWHRIVYHVKWSADPAVGFVSLWFDGTKVVDQAKAETYVDEDSALIQLGLLKDPPEPPQPIVLFVDEAIEGQSYADVSLGIVEVVPTVTPVATSTAATGNTGSASLQPTDYCCSSEMVCSVCNGQMVCSPPSRSTDELLSMANASCEASMANNGSTSSPITASRASGNTDSGGKSGCVVALRGGTTRAMTSWVVLGAGLAYVFVVRKRWTRRER